MIPSGKAVLDFAIRVSSSARCRPPRRNRETLRRSDGAIHKDTRPCGRSGLVLGAVAFQAVRAEDVQIRGANAQGLRELRNHLAELELEIGEADGGRAIAKCRNLARR